MKEQYGKLNIIYSQKKDGNMARKYGEEADENRQNFIKKMGLNVSQFLFMQPNNQDQVIELKEEVISSDLYYKLVEADAIICKYDNVFLYLSFADCIPFVMYDQKQHIFAFAHLGWRSTELNLHQKLFSIFKNQYHSKEEDLLIYMGPCIKKESYLLPEARQIEKEEWKNFVIVRQDGLFGIDLSGYVSDFFLKNGLKKDQIIITDVDTGKDLNYFSNYRANHNLDENGRFLFGVGMK